MSASPSIRVGVFDIGKVLLHFDFKRTTQRLASRCSLPPHEMDKVWVSKLVDDYARGRLSCEEFAKQAARQVGFSGAPEEFLEAWSDIFEPNPAMFDRVHRWKARGLRLFLLSNTCESHVRFFTKRWDIFRKFDGATYSCRVDALKPEPTIYRALLAEFGVEPADAVYLDDLEENIAAARAIGLRGIAYRNESDLVARLAQFGLD